MQLAADHDMLLIRPKSRLTAEQRHAILSYKETLKILLRCCDEGVQARRVVMKQRFDTAADPMVVPSLLFRCDVPDVAGVCFRALIGYGRCWRCSLAWRLASRAPLAPEFATAFDAARVAS